MSRVRLAVGGVLMVGCAGRQRRRWRWRRGRWSGAERRPGADDGLPAERRRPGPARGSAPPGDRGARRPVAAADRRDHPAGSGRRRARARSRRCVRCRSRCATTATACRSRRPIVKAVEALLAGVAAAPRQRGRSRLRGCRRPSSATSTRMLKAASSALTQWRFEAPAAAPAIVRVSAQFDLATGQATTGRAAGHLGLLRGARTRSSTFVVRRDAPPASTARSASAAQIRPPQKVVNVNPVYPQEAQDAEVQGVVIIEAKIGAGRQRRRSVGAAVDPDARPGRPRRGAAVALCADAAERRAGAGRS